MDNSSAILEAYKAVDIRVRAQSGIDSSGRKLMADALAAGGPIELASEVGQSGDDEREGFQLLFMGAAQGIRNPKAHDFERPPSAQRAFEYLSLASLMFGRLDDAVHNIFRTDRGRSRQLAKRIEAALPQSLPGRIEGVIGYPSSGVPPATLVIYGGLGGKHGHLIRYSEWSMRKVPFVFDSVLAGGYIALAYVQMDDNTLIGAASGKGTRAPLLTVAPGEILTGIEIDTWTSPDDAELVMLSAAPPETIDPGYEFLT